jgi:hypothetical protein
VSWSVHDLVQLEAQGVPTILVATEPFAALARHACEAQHLPEARVLVVAHPLGGIPADQVEALADTAVDDLLGLLT